MTHKIKEDLLDPYSRLGTPPNRERREEWIVRRMALAGGPASSVSRRGARGATKQAIVQWCKHYGLGKTVYFMIQL